MSFLNRLKTRLSVYLGFTDLNSNKVKECSYCREKLNDEAYERCPVCVDILKYNCDRLDDMVRDLNNRLQAAESVHRHLGSFYVEAILSGDMTLNE